MKQRIISLSLFILLVFSYTVYSQDVSRFSVSQLDSFLKVLKTERAYDKILPIAELGAKKAAERYGNQDTSYAKMLCFIAWSYSEMRDFAKAETYYLQAADIQKIKFSKHIQYAQTLSDLALLYSMSNQFDKAETFYKESISIKKELLGQKSEIYAQGINSLGGLYFRMGKYKDAESAWNESISIFKKKFGTKHPSYAGSLNNFAVLYVAMGRYEDAEGIYKESLLLRKELLGTKHPEYVNGLCNLGALYTEMGRYDEAEIILKESASLSAEIFGSESGDYSYLLNELGTTYTYMKRYDDAEALYHRYNSIQKKINPKGEDYAMGINNLANLYYSLNRINDAEKLFKEALALRKNLFGTKHPDYEHAIANLGIFYRETKKYAEAESLLKEGVQLSQELHGEKSPTYATRLNYLAAFYIETKEYDKALHYCQMAIIANGGDSINLDINKIWLNNFLSKKYTSIVAIYESLQHFYTLVGLVTNDSKTKQSIVAEAAILLLERNRHTMLNDADKLRMLEKSVAWIFKALDGLDYEKESHRAFALAEQTKSVLLLDAAKTARAYAFGDLPDSLAAKEQDLQNMQKDLDAALLENISEEEKKSVNSMLNELNIQIRLFKENIEKKYPKYAALKYKPQITNIKDIQALLNNETAFLEYLLEDSSVYVFYIDKNQVKLHRFFVSKKELTAKTKEFHTVLSNFSSVVKTPKESYSKYIELAYWFYKILLEKSLVHADKNIQNLIIVPDGELGYLPFEAFLEAPAPQHLTVYTDLQYLLKKFNISYNYSASLLAESLASKAKQLNANGQILAMASNYKITKNMEQRLPFYQRLRKALLPLEEAEKEVKSLMENFEGFTALDSLASEKVFKEKAADFSVIHLAMHGLLSKNEPILSSLAFTEDGDSVENNFLHAFEISKMKLNANLVVLSACETGYGKFETGNGIASLARAFMYAGAPSLVVSLWRVNDLSTAKIMKFFYENLAKGMSKDAALKQAKLEYIKIAEGILGHPAFWSPFVLIGNPEPIYLKTKSNLSIYLIIGGIVAALGIGAVAMRKRKES